MGDVGCREFFLLQDKPKFSRSYYSQSCQAVTSLVFCALVEHLDMLSYQWHSLIMREYRFNSCYHEGRWEIFYVDSMVPPEKYTNQSLSLLIYDCHSLQRISRQKERPSEGQVVTTGNWLFIKSICACFHLFKRFFSDAFELVTMICDGCKEVNKCQLLRKVAGSSSGIHPWLHIIHKMYITYIDKHRTANSTHK